MTPDESAWTQLVAVTLAHAADHCETGDAVRVAGEIADAMLAALRQRRESGAFEAQVYENERGNLDVNAPAPSKMDAKAALAAKDSEIATIRQRVEELSRCAACKEPLDSNRCEECS